MRCVTRKAMRRAVFAALSAALASLSAFGQATLAPSSLSFGNQAIGVVSSAKGTTLSNTSSSALTISSITISGGTAPSDYQSTTNCPSSPKTLPAGKSCTINITLTPTIVGSLTATLTVTDSASNSPQTVSLSGTGVEPVTLSGSSLSFGNVYVGNTSGSQTVTLTNNLKTTLTFTSIAASGDFAIASNTCGTGIAGGAFCKVGVTFSPAATGALSGTLTFTDSASNSPQSLSLSGTGASPVTITPTSLVFTSRTVGTTSGSQTVTVTNHLSTALPVSTPVIAGDYAISSNTCGASVAAGQKCTIGVTFTPELNGTCPGTLTISYSAYGSPTVINITGTGNLTGLASITVTPANSSIAKGTVQQFTATGNFKGGVNSNLTALVAWSSSLTSVATISAAGLANGSGQGASTISASLNSVAGSTTLTVGPPTLVSIAVTPATSSVIAGSTEQFTATGTYTDGSTQNLTSTVAWSSSATSVVTIAASGGLASAVAPGSTTITAASGAITGNATLTVTSNVLNSIAVTPANPSIPSGTAQQFTATGTYADGSMQNLTGTATWSSSLTSVATIGATGLATGVGQGSSTISATSNSVTGTTTLTVTAPALVSIAVTPANASIGLEGTQQFTATGTYTDNSTQNLTNTATWSSSSTNVATIAASGGLASAVASGTTTMQASASGAGGTINGSTPLSVAGFVLTGNLNTGRFQHTATQLDGGAVLIAGGSGPTGVLPNAELYSSGNFLPTGSLNTARDYHTATLLTNGMVLIVGGNGASGVLGSAELYNPASATFTTTGNLNTARYEHTATLLSNGMVLIAGGEDPFGNTLASAELYNPASGTFTLTGSLNTARLGQTATLLNNGQVLVAGGQAPPSNCETPPCNAIPMAAAELYNPATGEFTPTGSLNTARAYQTATLLDTGMPLVAGGQDNNGNILASAELYNVSAGTFSLTTGSLNTARYSHTATLLNNGTVLIAGGYNSSGYLASAEFYTASTQTFTVTGSLNTARDSDTATLLESGMVLIAGGTNSSGTLNIAELYEPATLTPANLVSIAVAPSTSTVSMGTAQQFVATGTFSDSSTQQLASATWSSSNAAAVSVTNDASDSGAAYGAALGTATVSACTGTVCGSAAVTVSPALVSIAVAPANGTVDAGLTLQFSATGTYSDGSMQTLTSSVTWSSSATTVATIAAGGLATGLVAGTTTITATSGSIQGSTPLTVASPALSSIAVTPSDSTASVGNTQQFTATGTYTDGSTQNLTSSVTWGSSTTSVATVTTAGVVASLTTGTSNISATLGSINGSTVLTVTNPLPTGSVSAVSQETCPTMLGGHDTFWVTNTSGGSDVVAVCYHATVTCPNMPDLGVTYGVATPTGTSSGTVVFISASEGTFTLIGNYKGEAPFDLYHDGYQTVQFAWDSGWQDGSTAGSLKSAACRIATFLSYMDTQYYLANPNNTSTAGLCTSSQSGGAGGLAYALTYYGSGNILDKAVFISGPQYGGLVQGCWVPNYPPVSICPSQNGVYAMGCNSLSGTWTEPEQYVGGAATKLGAQLANNPPCNDSSHTYTPSDLANLTAQSLIDDEGDESLNYPKTAITAWECDDDYYWQNPTESQGWLYLQNFTSPSQVAGNCNYSGHNTLYPNACFSVNRVYGCTSLELASSGYVCNGSTCPVCTGNPPTNCTCGGIPCSQASSAFAQKTVLETDMEDPVNGCIKRH